MFKEWEDLSGITNGGMQGWTRTTLNGGKILGRTVKGFRSLRKGVSAAQMCKVTMPAVQIGPKDQILGNQARELSGSQAIMRLLSAQLTRSESMCFMQKQIFGHAITG